MSEELKPVCCGCGGKPVVGHLETSDRWYIGCPDCDICTGLYNSEIEVIKAWNKSMGAKDINVPNKERTAKVRKYEYCNLECAGEKIIRYEYLCGECKKKVLSGDDYCSHCGAKLVWGDDE